MKVSIYSIILPRLEVPYLEYWIDYHLKLGVDNIVLYNNGLRPKHDKHAHWRAGLKGNYKKKNDQRKRLKFLKEIDPNFKKYVWEKRPYANLHLELTDEQILFKLKQIQQKYPEVTVVPWVKGRHHEFGYPTSQKKGFENFLVKFNPDWTLFIDPDEFVALRSSKNLKEFIEKNPGFRLFRFCQIKERARDLEGDYLKLIDPQKPVFKHQRDDFDAHAKWLGKIKHPKCLGLETPHIPEILCGHKRKAKNFKWSKFPEIFFFHFHRGLKKAKNKK